MNKIQVIHTFSSIYIIAVTLHPQERRESPFLSVFSPVLSGTQSIVCNLHWAAPLPRSHEEVVLIITCPDPGHTQLRSAPPSQQHPAVTRNTAC